ncbi:hypothetical protein [Actinoplanes sp. CA-252034]|uniref:hypothetical protein n=1 Tax=Actinoplanes sp. CA-252034 TaxID=3239906 RepID=UPI003D97EB36
MAKSKLPGTKVSTGEHSAGPRGVDMKGRMHVSELISDRAAAPSPSVTTRRSLFRWRA